MKLARSPQDRLPHGGPRRAQRPPARKVGRQPDRNATVVRTLLQRQNYTVKDLRLGQGLAADIPDDADVVLVQLRADRGRSRAKANRGPPEHHADRGGKPVRLGPVDSDGVTRSPARITIGT